MLTLTFIIITLFFICNDTDKCHIKIGNNDDDKNENINIDDNIIKCIRNDDTNSIEDSDIDNSITRIINDNNNIEKNNDRDQRISKSAPLLHKFN